MSGGTEGIEVPHGDPGVLEASAAQLDGVAGQLLGVSGQIGGLPSMMSGWAGPASSQFASFSGQEAGSMLSASTTVSMAASQTRRAAEVLEDAQRKAERAIERAQQAREEINRAREDIAEAEAEQAAATARMAAAAAAREAAQARALSSLADIGAGHAAALAAADAADREYRQAERDRYEAERRERHARQRLGDAQEDLRKAREDGREANESAEDMRAGLGLMLGTLPSTALRMPGTPATGHVAAAAGIPRAAPVQTGDVPIGEREPPQDWPGWAKSWFKIGRGAATAGDGLYQLGRAGYEHPERIPAAMRDIGQRAFDDPIGAGKTLIGYDELAAGRYEDWLGQAGLAGLTGGAGAGAGRIGQLRRIHGSPKLQPIGRQTSPRSGKGFAGRRYVFTREDLGVRPGVRPPDITIKPAERAQLIREYPKGVRFSRAGYPIFTPHAKVRLPVEGLQGNAKPHSHDEKLANEAAGFTETPDGYTWHHVEDGKTVELVPKILHKNVPHTGGAASIPQKQIGEVAPGGVLTPGERRVGVAGGAGGAAAGGPAATEGAE